MNRWFPGATSGATLVMAGCASQHAAVSPTKSINLAVDPSGKMPTDADTLAVLKGVQMIQLEKALALSPLDGSRATRFPTSRNFAPSGTGEPLNSP